VEALDKACLNLCEGQFIDLEFQEQLMVTETDYLDMISRKTGSLGRCAAETGAIAAGADDGLCAVFREAGNWLGMSWQISQDIADLWGERGDGMTPSNVLNKRKSLPVVHALENATVAAKRELGAIYMKRVLQPEDATRIVAILEESDSRSPAQNQARAMVEQAVASLVEAGIPQERLDDVRALGEWALSGQE
jgi:geranylgeranyl diphosphate synthase type I